VFSAPKACIVIATEDDIIKFLWGGEVTVTKLFLRVKVRMTILQASHGKSSVELGEYCYSSLAKKIREASVSKIYICDHMKIDIL
jgi:hypothetical protein